MQGSLRMAEAITMFDLRRRWPELKLLLEEGLETARRLGDHWYEVYHLVKLGECATGVHDLEQGFVRAQEALNAITVGMLREHYFRGSAYGILTTIMRERNDYTEAIRYAEMTLGEFRTHGNPNFMASAQLDLARAERARGQRGEALRLVEEVYQQSQHKGWKGHEQEAAYLRGELEREIGHPDGAEESARHALQLAREIKQKEEEVEGLLSLGKALKALGHKQEARTVWQEARQLSREREYEDHFTEAEELLSTLEQGGQRDK